MKTLINLFVVLFSAFSLTVAANAAENNGKIRVLKVSSSDYRGDYDNAMASDPWKGFNLAMFKFNNALDQYLLEPLARGYRYSVPQWGRDRVANLFNNIGETTNFLNSALQGDIEGVFRSFWRFVINTTFGVGGINDVAGGFGLAEKDKDFSQTLALYGLGSGPYLVVPFVGPSSPRDFVGTMADRASDPTSYVESPGSYIIGGANGIQTRENILDVTDDLKKNSFDLYSSYKSSYLQHRKKKVLDTLE